MSNNSRTNPMYVDSTGGMINPNTNITVVGIMILPSNATWAITIQDGDGKNKFFASNLGAGACMPPVDFNSTGLAITTLTNCTALIYTANI